MSIGSIESRKKVEKKGNDVDVGQQGDGAKPRGTIVATENYAMMPYVALVDKGEPLSRFEEMLIGRLIYYKKKNYLDKYFS